MNMRHEINLRHYEAAAAAGRLGSITKAAEAMNLSQPAITQAVAKVEGQLGHTLLERLPSGVAFTPAGALFAQRTQRALRYIARGGQSVRRAARLPALPHIERRVTYGHIKALSAVSHAGSFVLASASTGLSEPALHRSVRELEQVLGILLLTRQGRTVQPTPAATDLLRFLRLALAELEAGFDELAALRLEGAGRVTIGTLPMAQSVLLPRALSRFSKSAPMAQVTVVEGPYLDLLAGLRQGDMDVLVGALRQPSPVQDVFQELLFTDDPVIVGRADHPLALSPGFEPARLLDFPWIIPTTTAPMRSRWEAMFVERGLDPPHRYLESNSVVISRGLMLDDNWLTLMSRDQFTFERRAGLLVEIPGASKCLHREIGLTVREDWQPTQLQSAFVEVFREVCREWTSGKRIAAKPFQYA